MKINRNQTTFTFVTSAKKAETISGVLKAQGRLNNVIKWKNYKLGRIEYYIFYYNLK